MSILTLIRNKISIFIALEEFAELVVSLPIVYCNIEDRFPDAAFQ